MIKIQHKREALLSVLHMCLQHHGSTWVQEYEKAKERVNEIFKARGCDFRPTERE